MSCMPSIARSCGVMERTSWAIFMGLLLARSARRRGHSQPAGAGGAAANGNAADLRLDFGTQDIDLEQAVAEFRAGDLQPIGQQEVALELPGGNAAMQEHALHL